MTNPSAAPLPVNRTNWFLYLSPLIAILLAFVIFFTVLPIMLDRLLSDRSHSFDEYTSLLCGFVLVISSGLGLLSWNHAYDRTAGRGKRLLLITLAGLALFIFIYFTWPLVYLLIYITNPLRQALPRSWDSEVSMWLATLMPLNIAGVILVGVFWADIRRRFLSPSIRTALLILSLSLLLVVMIIGPIWGNYSS